MNICSNIFEHKNHLLAVRKSERWCNNFMKIYLLSQPPPPYPTEFLWRRVVCFLSFPLGIELKGQGIVLRGQGIELNSHFYNSTIPLFPGAFPLGIELNSIFVPWAQGTGIELNSQWKPSYKGKVPFHLFHNFLTPNWFFICCSLN